MSAGGCGRVCAGVHQDKKKDSRAHAASDHTYFPLVYGGYAVYCIFAAAILEDAIRTGYFS